MTIDECVCNWTAIATTYRTAPAEQLNAQGMRECLAGMPMQLEMAIEAFRDDVLEGRVSSDDLGRLRTAATRLEYSIRSRLAEIEERDS